MKYISAVFNALMVAVIMLELTIMVNYIQVNKRNMDTDKLKQAIEYSTDTAFRASLGSGNIGGDYEDLEDINLDPTNTLDTFATAMCTCYNMALTDKNKGKIVASIDSAVLANNDGYYILMPAVEPKSIGTGNKAGVQDYREYTKRWSMKLPYVYQVPNTDEYVAFNLINPSLRIYNSATGVVKYAKGSINKDTGEESYQNSTGGTYQQSVLNKNVKIRVINTRIADHMNYTIKQFRKDRDGADFNLNLSHRVSPTRNGVNAVKSSSLLVVISHADYAGKAVLNDAILSGYRTTKKNYVLGFTDNDGVRRYCYEGQLPENMFGEVITKYITVREAARDGYLPSYEYLKLPINKDKHWN